MICGGPKCAYHTGGRVGFDYYCDYSFKTGRTKLKQIYERYGIKRYDSRAAQILSQLRCPFYTPGTRSRRKPAAFLLRGSRRPRKRKV